MTTFFVVHICGVALIVALAYWAAEYHYRD